VVDDLLPHDDWQAEHYERAAQFVASFAGQDNLCVTQLDWATGMLLAVRRG